MIPDDVEDNIYSISPRFKKFADWLLQIRMAGNLEAIFPASTREYALMVEELWKDKAFLATYQRRNELQMLPRVANYFLDRVRYSLGLLFPVLYFDYYSNANECYCPL